MELKLIDDLPYIFDDYNFHLVYFVLFNYLISENVNSQKFIDFVNYCISKEWDINSCKYKLMVFAKLYIDNEEVKKIYEFLKGLM